MGSNDVTERPWALPDAVIPWMHIAVAHRLSGSAGIGRAARQRTDHELRDMAEGIRWSMTLLPHLLDAFGLPQLDGPGFWDGLVSPAIRAEVDRRRRPKKAGRRSGPLARIKALDIVAVASKFTQLSGAGNRLEGKCPLHQEKSPSFYVYVDSQRWQCYGACVDGGDVVDLVRLLAAKGAVGD